MNIMNDQANRNEEALEALRRAELRYRSIFEHCLEGIFQTTPDGKYLCANPALARIYGYESADDLIAALTDIGNQLYVEPARRTEFIRLVREEGKVIDFESQVYRRDRGVIWISETRESFATKSAVKFSTTRGWSRTLLGAKPPKQSAIRQMHVFLFNTRLRIRWRKYGIWEMRPKRSFRRYAKVCIGILADSGGWIRRRTCYGAWIPGMALDSRLQNSLKQRGRALFHLVWVFLAASGPAARLSGYRTLWLMIILFVLNWLSAAAFTAHSHFRFCGEMRLSASWSFSANGSIRLTMVYSRC